MTIMGLMKDNFKNFENKFQNEYIEKKEFTRSKTVHNDFIRVYYLTDGTSIGFAVNNINPIPQLDNSVGYYKRLFQEVSLRNKQYKTISDFFNDNKEELVNVCNNIEKENKSKIISTKEDIKSYIKKLSIKEVLIISYIDKKGIIFDKSISSDEFKLKFKSFIKEKNSLEDFKTFFELKKENLSKTKENLIEDFKINNKEVLLDYLDKVEISKDKTKIYDDMYKAYKIELKAFEEKLMKKFNYVEINKECIEANNSKIKAEQNILGAYYTNGLVKDYYINNDNIKNSIGFNIYKDIISKEVLTLTKNDLTINSKEQEQEQEEENSYDFSM